MGCRLNRAQMQSRGCWARKASAWAKLEVMAFMYVVFKRRLGRRFTNPRTAKLKTMEFGDEQQMNVNLPLKKTDECELRITQAFSLVLLGSSKIKSIG